MSVRLGGALRELRIHLCQSNKESEGIRQFIKNNYVKIKAENPGFPILVRECCGTQPRIWARYDKGVERSVSLTNQSADNVLTTLKQLVK